jgi:hypothetical protein
MANWGVAYAYGSGLQSATNSYNVSPGQPDSAWKVAETLIPGECAQRTANNAVGGGPSGFGQFQQANNNNGSYLGVQYRPFDGATAAFETPVVVDPDVYGDGLSVAQDGAGNVYATGAVYNKTATTPSPYPFALFYSGDGGKTWEGPSPIEQTIQPATSFSAMAVGSDGTGWLTYAANGTLVALQFSAADASNAFSAAVNSLPAVTGSTVTVPLSCYVVPCTVSTELTAAGTAAAASAGRKPTTARLGTGTVKITKHGVRDVRIHLSRSGAALLKKQRGGKLRALLEESTAVGALNEKKTVRVRLTKAAPSKRKHRRR